MSQSVHQRAAGRLAIHGFGLTGSPFARIFATGYDEMVRLTKGERGRRLDDARGTHVESITRRAAASEVTHLESWMSLLGTIGSTALRSSAATPTGSEVIRAVAASHWSGAEPRRRTVSPRRSKLTVEGAARLRRAR